MGIKQSFNQIDQEIAAYLNIEYDANNWANPFPNYAGLDWFNMLCYPIANSDKGVSTWQVSIDWLCTSIGQDSPLLEVYQGIINNVLYKYTPICL